MNEPGSSVGSDQHLKKPFYILIVDDDVEILRLLNDILCIKFPSVKIHTACNGAQALELLDDLTRKGFNIDFVLTDYEMPIMNGAELCKSIKQAHPNVKNAIMTCLSLPKDENLLYFDEIIYKPVDIDALFKSISDQMKNRGSTE
jgi:CheY-like chemotaxis protein